MKKNFKVTVHHIDKYVDDDNYKIVYERVVGIYDSLDLAINKLLDIRHSSEIASEIEDRDTRRFIIDNYAGDKLIFNEIFSELHDYPAFYVGPGILKIETTVLQ